ATSQGIGPGISIASDNTLGANNSNQGRLYMAYVDHINVVAPDVNPVDDTDIKLLTSDDGGATWSTRGSVNNDFSQQDGFSDKGTWNLGGATFFAGRPKFQPSVAVDPSTGTLVVTWYDARYDAARARVARFIATSLDGGSSFGPQTFLNRPDQPFD